MAGSGSSGGVTWHWRCLRRQRAWATTRSAISDWLETVPEPCDQLVLIGASGGWMMSGTWLGRFRKVHAYDLDPLAGPLFRLRHGAALRRHGTRLSFHCEDAIAGLARLCAVHPEACILFDNVLGQQRFLVGDPDAVERTLRQLAGQLSGRTWGSIHDLYSGPVATDARRPQTTRIAVRREGAGLTGEGRQGEDLQSWLLAQTQAQGVWLDHLTSEVFPPGHPSQLIHWPFLPGYSHWLQAGWVPSWTPAPERGARLTSARGRRRD